MDEQHVREIVQDELAATRKETAAAVRQQLLEDLKASVAGILASPTA